jgi:hypothetical protein
MEDINADISDQELILHQNHLAIKKKPRPELTDHKKIHAEPILSIPKPTINAANKNTTVKTLDIKT